MGIPIPAKPSPRRSVLCLPVPTISVEPAVISTIGMFAAIRVYHPPDEDDRITTISQLKCPLPEKVAIGISQSSSNPAMSMHPFYLPYPVSLRDFEGADSAKSFSCAAFVVFQ
jgi:hypothetical protein